jgi:hypothetical protein
MADSIWPAGSVLSPLNVGWTSGNGRAILRLQEDRNLVLYKDHNVAYPFPKALGRGHFATMQTDGNFVLYDHDKVRVWEPQERPPAVGHQDCRVSRVDADHPARV